MIYIILNKHYSESKKQLVGRQINAKAHQSRCKSCERLPVSRV